MRAAEQYADLYDRGIAVGYSDPRNDSMVFRFRDEVIELPIIKCYGVATYNGYFYTAEVEDLRKLKMSEATH